MFHKDVQNLQNFDRHKSNYVRKIQYISKFLLLALARPLFPHTLRTRFMFDVQNTVISPISCVTVQVQGVQITNGQITRTTAGVINRNHALSTTFKSCRPVQAVLLSH